MKKELQDQRQNYEQGALLEEEVHHDALEQFKQWYKDYEQAAKNDPNAFILATADAHGRVSSRVLLLKGVDQGGFEFYTNYESNKGRQLKENPMASMTFYWPELERQVRVEGPVEMMSEAESNEYFNSRPHGSQVGAWVSPQSEKIKDRQYLEERVDYYRQKFKEIVPKPPHWGGFRLRPDLVEFWQGRPSRLHDRLLYEKAAENWQISRLAP